MLTAYYSRGCDSKELFSGFEISKSADFETYRNKYNTISLNMQEFLSRSNNIEEVIDRVKRFVLRDLKKAYPDVDYLDDMDLIESMQDVYEEKKCPFVVIIDEWDCTFREFRQDKEAEQLCNRYKMEIEEVRAWYDGYSFPTEAAVYSPRSVVNSMLFGKIENYWNQTETFEALQSYIDMNFEGLKDDVLSMIAGESVPVNTGSFTNDMTTFRTEDDVLTLLIHLGYFAYDSDHKTVKIPNNEIRQEYVNSVSASDWGEVSRALKESAEGAISQIKAEIQI